MRVTFLPLLICIVFTPPGLAYLGLSSSQSLGTMIAGVLAIFLAVVLLNLSYLRLIDLVKIILLLILGLILHLVLAAVQGPVDFYRGLLSLLPLTLMILGAWAIAELFLNVRGRIIKKGLRGVLLVLGVVALLGVKGWLQPQGLFFYPKPVFPFSEPSHLAIISVPFFIFSATTARFSIRLILLIGCLLVALTLENLTTVLVFLIVLFFSIKIRYLVIFAFASIPILQTLDLSYYVERIDLSAQSQNLSALVYLQGWQLLQESMEKTLGMGVGFQQLGMFETSVTASLQLEQLLGESLNLMDGGFNLSKLISEFGIFGGVLLVGYLRIAVRAIFLLRRVSFNGESAPVYVVFSASCIVGYLVELLVRGVGYFTPTGMLLIASIIMWRRHSIPLMGIKPYLKKDLVPKSILGKTA